MSLVIIHEEEEEEETLMVNPEKWLSPREVLYKPESTKCAFCGYGFPTVDGQKQYWTGKDGRKYCCVEHADFGIDNLKEVLGGQ